MEALWIFPLYFICPLVGVILSIIGVVKIRNGSSKKTLITGLAFLSLPLFHLALITIFQFGLENKIPGKYNIGNEKGILDINKNGTFILRNSIQYNNSGNGTWEIEEIDFPILKLDFNQRGKGELWLQITSHENTISLFSMSWGNDISNEFTKEMHSR